jgi:ATP-dependent helicase HrpA
MLRCRHMTFPDHKLVLPILEKKDEILQALLSSQVVIIAGETGSGKTTQLPLICLEAGFGKTKKIAVTQPRRIAATSVAAYVAQQVSCSLGSFVGYKVRFNDKDSAQTKITFMTDGILLRELQTDKFLSRYDVIIIDEAHERSLNIDFLLGYMKMLLPKRPDLRLIISSATINESMFSKAFHDAPVITVSGRLFPIEILYLPEDSGDENDVSFVDAAADAVAMILQEPDTGDILVFMPTERDILETRDLLEGRLGDNCCILPLFGKMPLDDQTAIFRNFDKKKIVIATNIAETSLTVPNIRYVVDTGLARVKRYDSSMGITRLPIEPISQASARQRAGRCGRVQNGVCIRLYPEQDLLSRPEFTLPEIQRANLGQVILSMSSLCLGPVEEFPFIEPPSHQAVSQGYASLVELGALDKTRNLTATGKHMSHFPLDPALSRMIIEAHRRRCLREILVIASALCIQDMRVHPAEKKVAADAAHAKFTDPMSDFLFYLKLWDAGNFAGVGKKSLTQLRKFCKENFLSFVRMREWLDVYEQLVTIVNKKGAVLENSPVATYEQIHCCIVSGFISHVGKKNEDGGFQIAKGRKSSLFPGSSLFKKKPDWIVCAELVETSRVFSRTCASIDPLWLEDIAPHLCKHRYDEPYFDEETGGVKAKETVSLFGLVIASGRIVGYGRINPVAAGEVFIRKGLVEGLLRTHLAFFRHNKELYERCITLQKKLRTGDSCSSEQALLSFYSSKLSNVTSIHELNAVIKKNASDQFLFMDESNFFPENAAFIATLFPDSVKIGAAEFPISYEFDPFSELDGATVHVPSPELGFLNDTVFDWIIPGLFTPRIQYFLECLPKSLQRRFEPVSETAQKISSSLAYHGQDFLSSVCDSLQILCGVTLDPASLPIHNLPPHLMVKIAVKKDLGKTCRQSNSALWHQVTGKWERENIRAWDFGDLPPLIDVIQPDQGFPVFGYKGLAEENGIVECVVFTSQEERDKHHEAGVKRLLEVSLEKELAWLEKSIIFDKNITLILSSLIKPVGVKEHILVVIKKHCFQKEHLTIWKKSDFEKIVISLKKEINNNGPLLISSVENFAQDYFELQSMIKNNLKNCNSRGYIKIAEELKTDLRRYMDNFINNALNLNIFIQFPRYMKSFRHRIRRAFSDIVKYLPKHEIAMAYTEKANSFIKKINLYQPEYHSVIFEFASMVEEFKISLFAQQEVKTLYPVSQKKIDDKIEEIKKMNVF